jgi:hypothetical protein
MVVQGGDDPLTNEFSQLIGNFEAELQNVYNDAQSSGSVDSNMMDDDDYLQGDLGNFIDH